jgi:hypothetical protein
VEYEGFPATRQSADPDSTRAGESRHQTREINLAYRLKEQRQETNSRLRRQFLLSSTEKGWERNKSHPLSDKEHHEETLSYN